jgi:hypothetical protein
MPETKERPILFNGPMVRAVLDGRKTVTRRLVKGDQIPRLREDGGEWPWIAVGQHDRRYGFVISASTERECAEQLGVFGSCAYGRRGDRLWVREAWAEINVAQAPGEKWVVYREHDNRTDYGGPWNPSIHLRRRDSRILLEITGVRVERLQAISADQALAEGVRRYDRHAEAGDWFHVEGVDDTYSADPVASFAQLWKASGGDWDANPWVWVVEFKRVEQ